MLKFAFFVFDSCDARSVSSGLSQGEVFSLAEAEPMGTCLLPLSMTRIEYLKEGLLCHFLASLVRQIYNTHHL